MKELEKMPFQKPKKSLTTSNQAYEFALKILGNRDYSEQELRTRLVNRGATSEFVDETIAKLKQYKFLDEKRYAEKVYEAWLGKGIYGKQHLQAELLKKQVLPVYIPEILARLTEKMEQERALRAYKVISDRKDKKYDCTTEKGVAALLRYLKSRGFSAPAIHKVLEVAKAKIAETLE
jgi:regulatory protein